MKKSKEKLNSAITFFIKMIILVIIVSFVAKILVDTKIIPYDGVISSVNSNTNEIENNIVKINSVLSIDGFKYILGNTVKNFINFPPFVLFIVAMLGIGFLNKTGFIKAFTGVFLQKRNKLLITFLLIFLTMISSIHYDFAFVILMPIAGYIYYWLNRNPLIGVIAVYVSATIGAVINIVITNLDILLIDYTTYAAKTVDLNYTTNYYANYLLMIVCIALFSIGFTLVTERYLVKKLGAYKNTPEIEKVSKLEKKGLFASLFVLLVLSILLILMILPIDFAFFGILLDHTQFTYSLKLFGVDALFYSSFIFIMFIFCIVAGLVYLKVTKRYSEKNECIKTSLNGIDSMIILILLASMLVEILKYTNLPTVILDILLSLADVSVFSSILLILVIFIIGFVSNLFMTSVVTKWYYASTVLVPAAMQNNMAPEYALAVYRLGSALSTPITPVFSYFVIYLILLMYFKEEEISVKDSIGYTIKYVYIAGIIMIILLTAWYIFNLSTIN